MGTWLTDLARPNRRRRTARPPRQRCRPQYETLERRILYAISPTLQAIIPNVGDILLDGQTRNVAPRELTFRFDNGQSIDPASLGGIQIVASGRDGVFGNGNDQQVLPGFVGLGERPNEVVFRFQDTLVDDYYRITIFGQGPMPLKNTDGDVFNNGVNLQRNFRLDLAPQIVAVVPQPITRNTSGDLVQARDQIVVYYNNDPLNPAAAQSTSFYQLIHTNETETTLDDVVFNPISAIYNPGNQTVTLTFAQDLKNLRPGGGSFRLRIGDATPLAPMPILVNVGELDGLSTDPNDPGSSLATARNLGALGAASIVVTGATIRDGASPTNAAYTLTFPGGNNEPGHRDIPDETHLNAGADVTAGISVLTYNFAPIIGADPLGNTLFNVITETQKQRAREIFEIYAHYLGVTFIQVADNVGADFLIATGDLRALDPSVPTGPGGVGGIAGGGIAIMDAAENWGNSEFGGGWFQVAMHEIGHLLGQGHTYDLPPLTIQGSEGELSDVAAEPIFPGDYDIVHGQHLFRPESKDIDFYRFDLATAGRFSAEIIAERLTSSSLLDSVLSLYNNAGVLIARNDDYFSADSFLDLSLNAGTYYLAVSSTGNTSFNPNVLDSGMGGTTTGPYDLRLNFRPELSGGLLVDATSTVLDGNFDGRPGGTFHFWFQAGNADAADGPVNMFYVDKATRFPAQGNGTLGRPFVNLEQALAAAAASPAANKIVRVVGNGGVDGIVATVADNLPYEIGLDLFGNVLADGQRLDLPAGTTLMIDAGAIFKLRQANINAGSFSQGVNLGGSAIQVLGTPHQAVFFTSYHNEAIGRDGQPTLPTTPNKGDWGGLVFRDDSDREAAGIFLNYVSFADITYGGGQVTVGSMPQVYNPIHIITARPTVRFNRIANGANAAMSANPDAFEESLFRSNTFTADYRRVGPAIYGNLLVGNSINGLFVRIRTEAGVPVDVLTVAARFDDTDIVHVITENLLIRGTPGGPQLIGGQLQARLDARLAIDPLIIVKLLNSRIEVGIGAQLIAEGIPGSQVVFTSLNDDRHGVRRNFDTTADGAATTPAPGDWGGIYFHPISKGSLDVVLLTFAGGRTPIEGGFAFFNPLEIRQADVRLTRSILEFNANGQPTDGTPVTDRAGRGVNFSGSIFVRGAQPILVDNIIRHGAGPAININVNALNYRSVVDLGRSTGAANRYAQFDDNRGALVRLNRMLGNQVNGMVVRHGVITTQSIWDDTDIVHVVLGEIVVGNYHTYTGLRLQSSADASLVVKLAGEEAGFTASGLPLDIDDRIGGIVQIVGMPGHAVVLTSLADHTVGAGVDPFGNPLFQTVATASPPVAGSWRSVLLGAYSNDRNVETIIEAEPPYIGATDLNNVINRAQHLGILAADEKSGDENRRLGFEVHGVIGFDNPGDVDVYSFEGMAGSEVWLDIDRTSVALDTVLELIDASGQVLARSNDSAAESAGQAVPTGIGRIMQRGNFSLSDLYTTNPRDAGMRLVLPGNAGTTNLYYVRVRSNSGNLANLSGGQSSGHYQLQIRLRERDEIPGSTVRYADIRYATNGIELLGAMSHSPLIGEHSRAMGPGNVSINGTYDDAQDLGNLLASDRNTIAVSSAMFTPLDVQWYKFQVDYQFIQSIAGFSDFGRTWATVIDIDYADGLSRPDLTLALYDEDQNLLLIARDSDVIDDQPGPGGTATTSDLSRGSFGKLDAYLGTVHLPEGTARTYYLAVMSNAQIPVQLNQYYEAAPHDPLVKLEPINSLNRVVEDHIGSIGYVDSLGFSHLPDTGAILPVNDAITLATHVRPFTLSDVTLFVAGGFGGDNLFTYDAFTGVRETTIGSAGLDGFPLDDLALRSDGLMFTVQSAPNAAQNGNAGRLSIIRPGDAATFLVGLDGVANQPAQNPPPGTLTSDTIDALAYRRFAPAFNPGELGDHYALYYSMRSAAGSHLYLARSDGSANVTEGDPFGPVVGGDNRALIGPVGTIGLVTGMAWVSDGTTTHLYGVTNLGLFIRITNANGSFTADAAGNLQITVLNDFSPFAGPGGFQGLTIGPQNLVHNGTPGGLARTVFAITNSGRLMALDTTTSAMRTDVFIAGAPWVETGLVGASGLAFSPLDFNLWHPTGQLGGLPDFGDPVPNGDLGHGIYPTFDDTRTFLGLPETGLLGRAGGTSFYFGLEHWAPSPGSGNYLRYGTNAQFGILNPNTHLDLTGYDAGLIAVDPKLALLGPNQEIGNNYNLPGGAHGSLITGSFSLLNYASTDKPTLYFNYLLETQNANSKTDGMRDSARVFISSNGGASWTLLATNNSARSNVLLPDGELPAFYSQSASTGNGKFNQGVQELFDTTVPDVGVRIWRQARVDLSPFAGSSNLILRFDFATAGAIVDIGNPLNNPAMMGDQFGNPGHPSRGRDNHFRGFYIDDIIVGFAERGEMVTHLPQQFTGFGPSAQIIEAPVDLDPRSPSQVLVGAFQLEIRRGTEYQLVNENFPFAGIFQTFDTNDRFAQEYTLVAPSGSLIADGTRITVSDGVNQRVFEFDLNGSVAPGNIAVTYNAGQSATVIAAVLANAINQQTGASFAVGATFRGTRVNLAGAVSVTSTVGSLAVNRYNLLGDRNLPRDQGMILIQNNSITHSAGYGIVAGPAERDVNGPHPGAVRVLREINFQNLAPGAVLMNNLLAFGGLGGIFFAGDPGGENLFAAAMPYGRIVNNTIYGDVTPRGIGIEVGPNASPTILNNIVSNLAVGVQVSPSSLTTVLGTTAYKGNLLNTSGIGLGSNPITLSAAQALFINPSGGNFNLAAGSLAIDSSLNSLQDRPEMIALLDPLGIGPSPILAPTFDISGQLRVDDPAVTSPPGLGQDVFKDRGAFDRSDFIGPRAVLVNPVDNDPAGLDLNPATGVVRLQGVNPAEFTIRFDDGTGRGIDDATVLAAAFTLKRNNVTLVEGSDYAFIYDPLNNVARFIPIVGVWVAGNQYSIQIVNTGPGALQDLQQNLLLPNRADGRTLFELNLEALDFGDAPDPLYPTLLINDGPRHLIGSGLFLGANVTAETDGLPSAVASADSDDGVVFNSVVRPGTTASITVTSSGPGLLDAWLDFNGNGDFNDPGEQIFASRPLVAGANALSFAVPATTVTVTFARFRLSTAGGLSPTGLAQDGEVEDYLVQIAPTVAYTLVVRNDSNGVELPKDAQGRYVLAPGVATLRIETFVDDLRNVGATGGVFSAFADLQYSPNALDFVAGSLVHGPIFVNGRTGLIDETQQLVDEAGGVGEVSPTGADPKQLLFTVKATVNFAAPPGSVINLVLDPADELPIHETTVYNLDGTVAASYESVQLVLPANPYNNPTNSLDVNGDGQVTPIDALLVINQFNSTGSLPTTPPPPFVDVDADNVLTPLDALLVINFLNGVTSFAGGSFAAPGAAGGAGSTGGSPAGFVVSGPLLVDSAIVVPAGAAAPEGLFAVLPGEGGGSNPPGETSVPANDVYFNEYGQGSDDDPWTVDDWDDEIWAWAMQKWASWTTDEAA